MDENNQYQAPQPSQPQDPQANPYQQPQQPNPYQPQQPNPYQQAPYQQQPNPYQQAPYQQQANPYQQPNPYQQQGQYNPYQQGYAQPVPHQSNGLAIAAMVLGIASIVFCYLWYLGVAAGVTGLILSIIAKKKGPNKMATAGLICSIIGLGIATIFMIIAIAAYSTIYSYWY